MLIEVPVVIFGIYGVREKHASDQLSIVLNFVLVFWASVGHGIFTPPPAPEMLGSTVFRRQCKFRNMRKPNEHDIEKLRNVPRRNATTLWKRHPKTSKNVSGMRRPHENYVQQLENKHRMRRPHEKDVQNC